MPIANPFAGKKQGVALIDSIVETITSAIADLETGAQQVSAEIAAKEQQIARLAAEKAGLSDKRDQAANLRQFLAKSLQPAS